MNEKIAFLTTVFPMKEQYLYDFFDSLSEQTYNQFDIVVVNDGYENFNKIKNKYKKLNIIELPFSSTISKNREYGINYIIDNQYSILIFGDSDDYFSSNRVEKSLELLETNDIVVNDLSLFNEHDVYCKKYISNRISNNTQVKYDFIKDKNIFGFTNTAINIKILDIKVKFDKNIVAVDWFFYKNLLKLTFSAIFTYETETFYRQYESNTVGLKCDNNYLLWWEK